MSFQKSGKNQTFRSIDQKCFFFPDPLQADLNSLTVINSVNCLKLFAVLTWGTDIYRTLWERQAILVLVCTHISKEEPADL